MNDDNEIIVESEKNIRHQDQQRYAPSGTGGILANLSRTMLFDLNISHAKFSTLLKDYVHKINKANHLSAIKDVKLATAGNLGREMNRPTMTWKVFIKFLQALKYTQIRFIIQATHISGRQTVHSTEIDLGSESIRREIHEQEDPD